MLAALWKWLIIIVPCKTIDMLMAADLLYCAKPACSLLRADFHSNKLQQGIFIWSSIFELSYWILHWSTNNEHDTPSRKQRPSRVTANFEEKPERIRRLIAVIDLVT